ncbi:DNA-directed RNA polymerase III subunit RPC5-like [Polyodon spathula]|uniref:DNA-directed RNA polymerase III subunit RPC5-like n=1 Tax=Polyodon spathula TaxID=7913 RepID=UPI001B7DC8FD|nr:DNA-directed RNA polymerase III subunit RPC5-like [Polyodon spathula]
MAENTELVKSPSEYLTMLMPPPVEEEAAKPVCPSNVLSMAQLRNLPLGDQVRTLMKNVKVMPFANLMGFLSHGTDSTAVLRCIQQVAMLVQGNWVVKSDVLYPKDSCSPHSGVPAEVLCRGRDYVMWKFTQERWVERKAVAAVIKLPPEDVKDFMEQMSVTRINRGWEFLLPHDSEFIKKHPDVAQRQHMLWMGIQAKLEKVFKLSKEDMMPKKQNSQPGSVMVSGEQLVTAAREKVRENYSVLERELQQRHRADSQDLGAVRVKQEPLSDGEEPMDTSSAGHNNGAANGLYSDDSSRDSVNGPCLPRAHTAPTQELRDFVSSIFRKHFVLTLSELKRLFNLHLASLPPGHSLFSGISDRLLQEAVLDSKCKQILVPFPPQNSAQADEQKVFALWEMGDSFDQHRQLLLEIFMKNYRVRRNLIQGKLNQEFGDNVTKTDLDRLLKECCVSYGGMWYLKGTVQS